MKIEKISIDKIKPYENNAKLHPPEQIEQIKKSIKEFGNNDPIAIDENDVIIEGHGRCEALKELGFKEVEVIRLTHLNNEQKKAYILAHNKLTMNTGFDYDILSLELSKITDFDMSDFGFDELDLKFDEDKKIIKDEVPDIPKAPRTKPGEIYKMGNNRLMCGNFTKYEDVKKLMNNEFAKLAVTSPPYGVGKEYEEYGIEPWFNTVRPAIKNICKFSNIVCWNLGDLYTTNSQFIEPTNVYSVNIFMENSFKPIWTRIWEKQGPNFGNTPYHLVSNKPVQQYEYIWAFANSKHNFKKRLTHEENNEWGYYGIWKINTVTANKEHPAMFPIELPTRCIKMHSDKNDVILEPFAGSGTTLIACEQLKRKCFAMEIEPKYCDVIIERWENFTGERAVKISD